MDKDQFIHMRGMTEGWLDINGEHFSLSDAYLKIDSDNKVVESFAVGDMFDPQSESIMGKTYQTIRKGMFNGETLENVREDWFTISLTDTNGNEWKEQADYYSEEKISEAEYGKIEKDYELRHNEKAEKIRKLRQIVKRDIDPLADKQEHTEMVVRQNYGRMGKTADVRTGETSAKHKNVAQLQTGLAKNYMIQRNNNRSK